MRPRSVPPLVLGLPLLVLAACKVSPDVETFDAQKATGSLERAVTLRFAPHQEVQTQQFADGQLTAEVQRVDADFRTGHVDIEFRVRNDFDQQVVLRIPEMILGFRGRSAGMRRSVSWPAPVISINPYTSMDVRFRSDALPLGPAGIGTMTIRNVEVGGFGAARQLPEPFTFEVKIPGHRGGATPVRAQPEPGPVEEVREEIDDFAPREDPAPAREPEPSRRSSRGT